MNWDNVEKMDPDLLVGIVNTAIRNHFGTLEELCKAEGINPETLRKQLAAGDYEYLEAAHQFR